MELPVSYSLCSQSGTQHPMKKILQSPQLRLRATKYAQAQVDISDDLLLYYKMQSKLKTQDFAVDKC